MLNNVTDRVIREDDILKRTWPDRVMHPKLRNPTSKWDIVQTQLNIAIPNISVPSTFKYSF
eukprot:8196599-Prorocentrum_lima.AAC.1